MKTFNIFILSVLCLSGSTLFAQSTLSGTVLDEAGKPIPFATIGLLAAQDSSLVKATSADPTGVYVLEDLPSGRYLVKATSVGYHEKFTAYFELANSPKQLQDITLAAAVSELNEVRISAKKPFVEQLIDRMVVNVEGSVIVQIDGNSGIINIKLKKNRTGGPASLGTNGALSLAGGSGIYDKERASIQLNNRTEKLNLFGSYSLNRGGNLFCLLYSSIQPDPVESDPGRQTYGTSTTYLPMRDLGQNAKAGLDFSPTKNTIIGVVWTGLWNQNKQDGTARSIFSRTESGPAYLQADTRKTQNTLGQNQIGNLNVQHSFGDKGQLSADADFGQFNGDFTNDLLFTNTISPDGDNAATNALLNFQPTTVKIRTAKTDYSQGTGQRLEDGNGPKNGRHYDRQCFSYSYRIDRPNYQILNPARSCVDPFAFSQGNAFLRPQYTPAFELRYGLKNGIFLALGANMTTDFVNGIFYALEGNKRYRIMQNVGDAQGFSIVAGMPLTATQFLNTSPWLGSMDIGVQKAVSKALKVKFSLQEVFYTNRFSPT